MKNITILLLATLVSGCVTLSGIYTVTATQADGTAVPVNVVAEGSGIYTARNGICAAFPGATVRIADRATGKELQSESPYRCR